MTFFSNLMNFVYLKTEKLIADLCLFTFSFERHNKSDIGKINKRLKKNANTITKNVDQKQNSFKVLPDC